VAEHVNHCFPCRSGSAATDIAAFARWQAQEGEEEAAADAHVVLFHRLGKSGPAGLKSQARLRSCARHSAFIFLDTMPIAAHLIISNTAFAGGLHHCRVLSQMTKDTFVLCDRVEQSAPPPPDQSSLFPFCQAMLMPSGHIVGVV
jgi:hypothetical protein